MDLTTIEQALADLYTTAGHLPRPDGLAKTVLDAYNDDTLGPNSPWRRAGIVAALWPIGAAAGAQRGHTVTIAAFRDQVAGALTDTSLDARGRFVVTGLVQAADNLPSSPDPSRAYNAAQAGVMDGHPRDLPMALRLGLTSSWMVGHRQATDRAIARFHTDVVDLIGPQRLSTTFLVAQLPAYAALEEIEFAAYRSAEADREDPSPHPVRTAEPPTTLRTARPHAARGFVPIGGVDPARRFSTKTHIRPSTGPGRPGPGR
jgi:hypothetical protein